MRTYPDGWKVDRGPTNFAITHPNHFDDRVLFDSEGEVVASRWVHLGSETVWGYRHWVQHSPVGRAHAWIHVASLMCITSGTAGFFMPVWWAVVNVAVIVHLLWRAKRVRRLRKESRNGSDRGTEEDHQDSEAERAAGYTGAGSGQGASEDSGLKLDVVFEDMPILAHRYAKLVPTESGLVFGSVTDKGVFGIDAIADCLNWRMSHLTRLTFDPRMLPEPHDAPGDDCDCGFYAVPADKLPEFPFGGVSLLVELSGKVIEHAKGYRAEHQRVVQVTAPPCPGCGQPSKKAWRNQSNLEVGLVWDCGNHEMLPISANAPIVAMTLDQIAGVLGVPVVAE